MSKFFSLYIINKSTFIMEKQNIFIYFIFLILVFILFTNQIFFIQKPHNPDLLK